MTQRRQVLIGLGLAAAACALKGTTMAHAETAITTPDWTFESIYGGNYGSADFAGKVVLLVNTASLCGYTPQYSALQKLQDTYMVATKEKAEVEAKATACVERLGLAEASQAHAGGGHLGAAGQNQVGIAVLNRAQP